MSNLEIGGGASTFEAADKLNLAMILTQSHAVLTDDKKKLDGKASRKAIADHKLSLTTSKRF